MINFVKQFLGFMNQFVNLTLHSLSLPQTIIIGFANSVDPDEPSHLDLRCLRLSLST